MTIPARGAIWLFVATNAANLLGYVYQAIMARLLGPADFAALTALFAIVAALSLGTQVLQASAARIAARYRALSAEHALRSYVKRWSAVVLVGSLALAVATFVAAGWIADRLALSQMSVELVAVTLIALVGLNFTGGLLQGLHRSGWLGTSFVVQAGARLGCGVGLVVLGYGVDGAFAGLALALLVGLALNLATLRGGLSSGKAQEPDRAALGSESALFVRVALVLLAYGALTNIDAAAAHAVLPPEAAGAYAAAVTIGKVVLFLPMAVGFVLLERTARADALGHDTIRPLVASMAVVFATSGVVALGYVLFPGPVTRIVVGDSYPMTMQLVGRYALVSLSNAVLAIWNAYFIGRGDVRIGGLFLFAAIVEGVLIFGLVRDVETLVWLMVGLAISLQVACAGIFAIAFPRPRPNPA